ncbi:MAG: hypothetical protein H7Y20_14535, partial [Bryobacteraceae bacterium]|nr:hypothetical protein [Bryobacteraceae bacterium]
TEILPTELNQTEVRLGDRALRLLFSSGSQINAQIPYDLSPDTEHQLVIRRAGALSVPEQFVVASAQPAIFSADQSGSGQAVITNSSNGQLANASNPVKAGDTIVILCTGLGKVTPEIDAGSPTPLDREIRTVLKPVLTIGGVPANVTFSGLQPGVVGRYMVTAVVPDGVSAGDAVYVVLNMSKQSSKPVTIAVR